MIWQDLMLDRWVDEPVLRAAIGSAFDVPATSVAVVDRAEQIAEAPSSARIVLERTRQHRDFPLQVLVVLRDDTLVTCSHGFEGVLRVTRTLAERLGAAVLFAEGPVTPAEWVRVLPTGAVDLVSLDADEAGEVDSFFVVDQRALPPGGLESASSAGRLTA